MSFGRGGKHVRASGCGSLARLLVSVLASALASVPASAQPHAVSVPGQLQWIVGGAWRQAQGLPQDRVIAIHQTRDGYLWVGTRGGGARFDGDRFTVWNSESPTRLPEGEVFAFAEPKDGGLWIAVYGGGLTRFLNGRFTTLTTSDGLVDNYVRSISISSEGTLWVGTDRGLSRYRDNAFTNVRVKGGLADETVRVVLADQAGDGVLVGTDRGLQHFADGRFSNVALAPSGEPLSVDTIVRDRSSQVWVGTSDGLFRLSGSSKTAYGPSDGLSSRAVRSVLEDSKGRLWVATNKGLDRADSLAGSGRHFVPVITEGDVTAVIEDQEGSIWVGYRGHGLVRLQRSLFKVFDSTTGLSTSGATTVFQSREGTVWAGAGTSLTALRGPVVRTFGVESGLPDRPISALAEDGDGRIWVGTEGGLFRSAAPVHCVTAPCRARFVRVVGQRALDTHIRVLCPEGRQGMFAGTNANGVVHVDHHGAATALESLAGSEVRAIVRDGAGRLWVGTRNRGLVAIDGRGVTAFTTQNGLPHQNVQSLFLDRDGILWIATRRGLAWLRDGSLASATVTQGLRENHIYGMTDDTLGRLWMSSGNGVFTVLKRDLLAYGEGTKDRVTSVVYGLEHGLPSTLCALSHHPVITTTADGHVWVATLGGLVETDPSQPRAIAGRPPIHVESLAIDQVPFMPGSLARALHDKGSLVFTFSAPSYLAPDRIVFRYRLEGFDPAWIDGGAAREARFTNIPPGRFRFTVVARNGDGAWSDTGASAEIELIPHLYQRWWFFWLIGLGFIGVGGATGVSLHRTRVRRLEASERELARRVDDAVAHIKVLRGLLPVCAWCRRVRDDTGYWTQMEAYIREHSQAEFSHGLCPDCLREHFPEDAPLS